MFGEKFFNFGKKNDFQEDKNPEKKLKGSFENPYSKKEFDEIQADRLKHEQMKYFFGYVDNSDKIDEKDIQYFDFACKDDDYYSINGTKSQRRIAVLCKTKEDGKRLQEDEIPSVIPSYLSFIVKNNGEMKEKASFQINYDLPINMKKELASDIYMFLNDKFSELFKVNKIGGLQRDNSVEELKKEIIVLISRFVRKEKKIEDDYLDISLLEKND